MKHIIFLFLTINIVYITAGDNFAQNQPQPIPLQQQQRNEQALHKKLKNYNQNTNFNKKKNTRAQLNQKNNNLPKFTRTSHPR